MTQQPEGYRRKAEAVDHELAVIIDKALFRHPTETFPPSHEREVRPYDYWKFARLKAAFEAADFMENHFPLAANLINRVDLLQHACSIVNSTGDALEFGVMDGRTLKVICEALPHHSVYGFDSFLGLPEDWRHDRRKGEFSRGGSVPAGLPPTATIIPGMFAETIPSYLAETASNDLSLLHIDCDLYSSTRDVLFGLRTRIGPGTIIVFDEFLNYPGWREHEYKALTEFVSESGAAFEYVAFASSYLSVAIRITRRGS
ncbi:class I SAM-dependent methyltransferase (plasmid) [Agrobacterium tumefaciens]|uniref:TylF/MycF/NovP-related O-methyltransferase n=1 Tax=Agrobacterium tumefaciens TaxID=358 RepID=UPI001574C013|nr:TylF/MycF/NovP-related O-methyltransferase [Agrobacterium tumefaciens]NSZ87899.1 class I SAM-dependent methyltransferase [Agrobacterium tumefaciens]WCA72914.1 class I SAM-dependent methyltransferase [Agrobacterium tumefaciens]